MRSFKRNLPPTLLFIAGEGGHMEQARRLLAQLEPDVRAASHCVLITDSEAVDGGAFDACWVIDTCAPKHRASGLRDALVYTRSSARILWRMLRRHDVRMTIVTGPGFSMLPALGARLLGAELLVFESWSRFEQRSKCGRVLYRFAHHFFVQHEELLALYPRARWVGLL